MLIETPFPPALGTEVRIHFQIPDSQASIMVRAEVKNHYVFNYSDNGDPKVASSSSWKTASRRCVRLSPAGERCTDPAPSGEVSVVAPTACG